MRVATLLMALALVAAMFADARAEDGTWPEDTAIATAKKAAEPALQKAYKKWADKAKKQSQGKWTPPERDKPWLEEQNPTSVKKEGEGKNTVYVIVWKNYPPAGWTWDVEVKVAKGKAKVVKATASFPPE